MRYEDIDPLILEELLKAKEQKDLERILVPGWKPEVVNYFQQQYPDVFEGKKEIAPKAPKVMTEEEKAIEQLKTTGFQEDGMLIGGDYKTRREFAKVPSAIKGAGERQPTRDPIDLKLEEFNKNLPNVSDAYKANEMLTKVDEFISYLDKERGTATTAYNKAKTDRENKEQEIRKIENEIIAKQKAARDNALLSVSGNVKAALEARQAGVPASQIEQKYKLETERLMGMAKELERKMEALIVERDKIVIPAVDAEKQGYFDQRLKVANDIKKKLYDIVSKGTREFKTFGVGENKDAKIAQAGAFKGDIEAKKNDIKLKLDEMARKNVALFTVSSSGDLLPSYEMTKILSKKPEERSAEEIAQVQTLLEADALSKQMKSLGGVSADIGQDITGLQEGKAFRENIVPNLAGLAGASADIGGNFADALAHFGQGAIGETGVSPILTSSMLKRDNAINSSRQFITSKILDLTKGGGTLDASEAKIATSMIAYPRNAYTLKLRAERGDTVTKNELLNYIRDLVVMSDGGVVQANDFISYMQSFIPGFAITGDDIRNGVDYVMNKITGQVNNTLQTSVTAAQVLDAYKLAFPKVKGQSYQLLQKSQGLNSSKQAIKTLIKNSPFDETEKKAWEAEADRVPVASPEETALFKSGTWGSFLDNTYDYFNR